MSGSGCLGFSIVMLNPCCSVTLQRTERSRAVGRTRAFKVALSASARAAVFGFICPHFGPSCWNVVSELGRAGLCRHFGLLQAGGAAAERKTSGGMNQTKERIIPSPRMTRSSDPESVFRPARLPRSTLRKWRGRERACRPFIFRFHNSGKFTAKRRRAAAATQAGGPAPRGGGRRPRESTARRLRS